MADTKFLRGGVEDYVRAQLEQEFGQSFSAQFLQLRTGGRHEFDAVSADGSIVAGVKAASGRTSGGHVPSGKIKDSIAELYCLSLVAAPVRRLVLTTPEFFDIFTKITRGAVAEGIDVISMRLPDEIQAKVNLIVIEASREVSPALAEAAVAAEIETEAETPESAS